MFMHLGKKYFGMANVRVDYPLDTSVIFHVNGMYYSNLLDNGILAKQKRTPPPTAIHFGLCICYIQYISVLVNIRE